MGELKRDGAGMPSPMGGGGKAKEIVKGVSREDLKAKIFQKSSVYEILSKS